MPRPTIPRRQLFHRETWRFRVGTRRWTSGWPSSWIAPDENVPPRNSTGSAGGGKRRTAGGRTHRRRPMRLPSGLATAGPDPQHFDRTGAQTLVKNGCQSRSGGLRLSVESALRPSLVPRNSGSGERVRHSRGSHGLPRFRPAAVNTPSRPESPVPPKPGDRRARSGGSSSYLQSSVPGGPFGRTALPNLSHQTREIFLGLQLIRRPVPGDANGSRVDRGRRVQSNDSESPQREVGVSVRYLLGHGLQGYLA